MVKKITLFLATIIFCGANLSAQIGYQVSLLNSATGVPRANETVTCLIELSNTDGVFYIQTQSVTTNDFGVLSLQIGNETTFQSADAIKLPLFVSVMVDGTLVGKSQILSVPLAENLRPFATGDDLFRTWSGTAIGWEGALSLSLTKNYTFTLHITDLYDGDEHVLSGPFVVQGNVLYLIMSGNNMFNFCLIYSNGALHGIDQIGGSYGGTLR